MTGQPDIDRLAEKIAKELPNPSWAHAALDELVALAGRADELERDAEAMRAAATIRGSFRDEWRRRAEAAEAREDELQRELRSARKLAGGAKLEWLQVRREADQLRAERDLLAMHVARPRYVNGKWTGKFLYSHGSFDKCEPCQLATGIARAAFAGVQADNKDSAAPSEQERDKLLRDITDVLRNATRNRYGQVEIPEWLVNELLARAEATDA